MTTESVDLLFNSIEFLIFLPTVYFLYLVLGHTGQNRMLLAASYLFYGWWDERFLYLIVLSTAVDFCAGLMIEEGRVAKRDRWLATLWVAVSGIALIGIDWSAIHWDARGFAIDGDLLRRNLIGGLGGFTLLGTSALLAFAHLAYPHLKVLPEDRRRRVFLLLSVAMNLGLLGFFKYFNFFIDSAEIALAGMGVNSDMRLDVLLPVGISFYTFQTMSYTIDVYRGQCRSTGNFLDFALFVSFFPQLVAGPIERATSLLPQILAKRQVNYDQITRGLFLILLGLFKKVAIADGLAGSVDSVYSSGAVASAIDIYAATLAFTFQIYCDFSGYSDIARGTSKLLGINLMRNFSLPYFAKSPSDFWDRWHISLSTWLRDYLYIPLGGNRQGTWMTYRNLMLTMVLGGLWHGAAWNYVLWGTYQGSILCIYRALGITEGEGGPSFASRLRQVGAIAFFFFVVVVYGWMLFRAESMVQVWEYTWALFSGWGEGEFTMRRPTLSALGGIGLLLFHDGMERWTGEIRFYRAWWPWLRGAFFAALFFLLLMGTSNEPAQFIYFQF